MVAPEVLVRVLFYSAVFCDSVDQQRGQQAHCSRPGIEVEIEHETYHCAAKRGMRQPVANITHTAQYDVGSDQAAKGSHHERCQKSMAEKLILERFKKKIQSYLIAP